MSEERKESESFGNIDDVLKQLTAEQLRFVQKRLYSNSDAEAANAAGIPLGTMYKWSDWVRVDVPKLLAMDGVHLAAEMRRRVLPDAMAVKVDGLKSMDEKLRQNVATELIEWEMGKAVQRTQMDTKGDITLRVVYQDGIDDQSTQAA
jgi:hypothetical protein